ncbi:MAG TPA: cytochrome c oxidase subunit II [Terriglobia bacterium]|nr:cytochrome c oxidase subunit II [Terriglobia bacterium]
MMGFPLFPEVASTIAQSVDLLYLFLVAVTVLFSGLIFVCILYFAVKYRRKPGKTAEQIHGVMGLEIAWSVVPFLITLVMFTWGSSLYVANSRVPDQAMDVYVVGKQWMWKIQHPSGRSEINELHVPVGKAVKLTLTSQDVIHSFYIPAFRVKQDVLPGRYVTMWFQPTRTGEFHLFCAEYCGTSHSGMIGRIVTMEPDDFQRWLGGVTEETPVQTGERLFSEFNCVNCHATGARQRCPQLGGLYGTDVEIEGGGRVKFDEPYIRESIINPNAKIVKGYPPVMPTYRGQISEEQILDLIAYIRSLTPEKGQ